MLVEAFLIVEQPRQRLSHWSRALAPLDDNRAPALASVGAHYDPVTDQALIALRYDELALGKERLAFVIEIALLGEIGMIQPATLSEGDRKRFIGERLTRCTINVVDQRSVVGALAELVRRVREARAQMPRQPAARGSIGPRGTADDPVLLVTPKSTRDDVHVNRNVLPFARSTRDELRYEPVIKRTFDDVTRKKDPPPPPEPPPLPIANAKVRPTSPHVIPRPSFENRVETVQLSPIEIQRMLEGAEPEVAAVPAIEAAPVEPPEISQQLPPGIIYARYLRSGRWVPLRIGALSLKGGTLMTGALPRLHDRIDVALAYAGHRALVRGVVAKVSTAEEAALTGTPAFTMTFELDATSRRQLTTLLTAARAAHVTIKPPPPRQARRYPVEWPVCLGTMRGAVRGDALDVSRAGMFVRPTNALSLDANLSFSAVLDDGEGPISGRAKVVRHITETNAHDAGLSPGYGLHIVDMARTDYLRWHDFLVRIEKRAEKRVLIGATPARLAELQAGLAAAGYAVTGGSDPSAIVELAHTTTPVDACLIDSNWLTPATPAAWIESAFAARDVPCVMLHGDARRARATVDKILAIV